MYYAVHLMLFNCLFFSVVQPKIELLITPGKHVQEGESANLTCKIIEGFPEPEISWLKDGEPLAKEVKTTLILTKATDRDEGMYTCIAQNTLGNSTDSIDVAVKSKLIIIMIILTIKSIRVLFS